jgi:glucosamine-6-phosphate deaminase
MLFISSNKWTLSALQLHPWALIVADEDATAGKFPKTMKRITINKRVQELHVKTVKYFKSIERTQDEVEIMQTRPDSIWQATAPSVKVGNLD